MYWKGVNVYWLTICSVAYLSCPRVCYTLLFYGFNVNLPPVIRLFNIIRYVLFIYGKFAIVFDNFKQNFVCFCHLSWWTCRQTSSTDFTHSHSWLKLTRLIGWSHSSLKTQWALTNTLKNSLVIYFVHSDPFKSAA